MITYRRRRKLHDDPVIAKTYAHDDANSSLQWENVTHFKAYQRKRRRFTVPVIENVHQGEAFNGESACNLFPVSDENLQVHCYAEKTVPSSTREIPKQEEIPNSPDSCLPTAENPREKATEEEEKRSDQMGSAPKDANMARNLLEEGCLYISYPTNSKCPKAETTPLDDQASIGSYQTSQNEMNRPCAGCSNSMKNNSTSADTSICCISPLDFLQDNPLYQVPVSLERASISRARRKLLILDLNGLLVDIVGHDTWPYRPDMKVNGRSVFKRPFCDNFLNFCFESFDIAIWSSRNSYNLNGAINFLLGDKRRNLRFCWDQSRCTTTGFMTLENRNKPIFFKELKKVWNKEESDLPWEKGEYTISNTLLLDDSPYKALLNPPNTAIFPRSYTYTDGEDKSLGPGGDLRVFLEGLTMVEDVPGYVQEHPFGENAITDSHPHWSYYVDVIRVANSLEEESKRKAMVL